MKAAMQKAWTLWRTLIIRKAALSLTHLITSLALNLRSTLEKSGITHNLTIIA